MESRGGDEVGLLPFLFNHWSITEAGMGTLEKIFLTFTLIMIILAIIIIIVGG